MYKILIDHAAEKKLQELPERIGQRVEEAITRSANNPVRWWKRLVNREEYSLRIGDYRVLATINHELRVITITHIAHRKNVYKEQ